MTYDECVERMVPHLEEAERMQEAYYWHMFGVLVFVTAQAFGLTVGEVEAAVRRRAHRKRALPEESHAHRK